MDTTTWPQRIAAFAAGVIDVHTHLIDPDLPDIEHPGVFPTVRRDGDRAAAIYLGGREYRRIDSRSWSAEARLRDMDAAGVGVQIVSPIPVTLCHGEPAAGAAVLAAAQNDHAARFVANHPDRFVALGAVPLQDTELAVAELRRCVGDLDMAGVEVGTRVGDRELCDPALAPFFAAASELGAVLLVHPVDETLDPRLARLGVTFGVGMPVETATGAAGLLAHGTLCAAPGAQVVLAHGGGALAAVLPRVVRGQRIQDPGIADADLVTTRARQLWADSLTYDPLALEHVLARFGGRHVVLGTDYPFAAREDPPGATLAALGLLDACGRTNALDLCAGVHQARDVERTAP